MNEIRIAMIGLDASHTPIFTTRRQHPERRIVEGMRVIKAARFPLPIQMEAGQDERQALMESMGVVMAPDVGRKTI